MGTFEDGIRELVDIPEYPKDPAMNPDADHMLQVWDADTAELSGVGVNPITADHFAAFSELQDSIASAVEAERKKIEHALQQAILDGYDGVDVNRNPPGEMKPGIVSIEPWHYPEPEDANGYQTERYEWKWFDTDELREYIREDRLDELVEAIN